MPIRPGSCRSRERILPWLAAVTALAFAYGFWLAAGAPDDYQQGATVKIMFIHVPSAWLAMFGWMVDEHSLRSARWCGGIRLPTIAAKAAHRSARPSR